MSEFPTLTAAAVKKAALDLGADLVGIGSIDRWENAPADQNPKNIMPRAKSVICIGFRSHRGSHRGREEGTYYSAYTLMGVDQINKVLAPFVQHRLASFIEDHGYECMPIMHFSNNLGIGAGTPALNPDGTEKLAPDAFMNFRISAMLCGVGEIGLNRLLLTPQFGPAQRIFLLLTEAELEADPIITGICDRCGECIKSCPTHALSANPRDDVELPEAGNVMRCSLDPMKCGMAHSGGAFSPFASPEVKAYAENIANGKDGKTADGNDMPGRKEVQENVHDKVPYSVNARKDLSTTPALCANCMRSCLAHLDKTGKLERKFVHPFRD